MSVRLLASLALLQTVLHASACCPAGAVHTPRAPAVSRPTATVPVREPEPLVLSVMALADLHGHVEALPLYAGYVDAVRGKPGHTVLLVDGGDMFQGTLESNLGEGDVVVEAYDALGVAAAAIGNHEFDFGPEGPAAIPASPTDDPRGALRARARQARFPFLLANVTREDGRPLDWDNVVPSVVVALGSLRVGLVGVTTLATPTTTIAPNFAGLRVTPLADAIVREAASLRARGASVVIALAHAGSSCTSFDDPADVSSCEPESEVFDLARALPAGTVDLIVGGHAHGGVAHVVGGVPIIEAPAYGRAFARANIVIDRATGRPVSVTPLPPHELCPPGDPPRCSPSSYEGAPVTAAARLERVIAPAVARADGVRSRPIGARATAPLARSHDEESALGNLFADLLLASVPGAHVAVMNGGGLRADLPAGELRFGALFTAMPFDNRVATLRLTGTELAAVVLRNLGSDDGILSLAGVTAEVTCAPEGGNPAVRLRRANGRTVRPRDLLTVVASDFLVMGGSAVFSDTERAPARVSISDRLLRDALADQLSRRAEPLDPARLFDPARRRLAYPGPRPLRCPPPG
ncbi:MAG: bifunctional metallophosphatase/5'-nucleotidase [Micrococcales bacterium]|nr:bifunctional metallophosphatase/5'-nucleotidase [Micrococcales bacterium]